jgi:hypothetical protein
VAKKILVGIGVVFGAYLIVRAIFEPFVIDMSDPSTYEADWGGPSLAGVLLVHCGPGVVSAIIFAILLRRRRASRARAVTDQG